MISQTCEYETTRLSIGGWHGMQLPPSVDLPGVVCKVLTDAVTRSLPPSWHGPYSRARARAWIDERDAESATLLALDRASGEPVGFVILSEHSVGDEHDRVDLRLGYLLAESAWGRGLASELVEGLVRWCRSQPSILSITGGVAGDNIASARVLTKNGFTAIGPVHDGEQIYRLSLLR